jgi:TetR/AcrR family transcriptional repressor of nem operon
MGPKPTRRNDPDRLRAHVLDVAANLFQTQGYHATSMHDLMRATGVSGGALHHHFPTKKSLGLAVITDRVAATVQEAWIDPVRLAPSLSRGVASVFAGIIAGMEARGSVSGCPLNNLALELAFSDSEFRIAIQAIFAAWRAAIADRISRTAGGARLDHSKRAAAADFVISSYSGAMNIAKAMQDTDPLRSCARVVSQWLREREFAG